MRKTVGLLVMSLCLAFTQASAEAPCKLPPPVEQSTASASTWANLRKKEGSLRAESERLITRGYKLLKGEEGKPPVPEFILTSTPSKFLADYGDVSKCSEKLKATSAAPIAFHGLKFDSVDKMIEWFGDFSQGSGTEGKKLYELCDGDCSPQYTLNVSAADQTVIVNANIICGHARDKDDDTYKVALAVNPCRA